MRATPIFNLILNRFVTELIARRFLENYINMIGLLISKQQTGILYLKDVHI